MTAAISKIQVLQDLATYTCKEGIKHFGTSLPLLQKIPFLQNDPPKKLQTRVAAAVQVTAAAILMVAVINRVFVYILRPFLLSSFKPVIPSTYDLKGKPLDSKKYNPAKMSQEDCVVRIKEVIESISSKISKEKKVLTLPDSIK